MMYIFKRRFESPESVVRFHGYAPRIASISQLDHFTLPYSAESILPAKKSAPITRPVKAIFIDKD